MVFIGGSEKTSGIYKITNTVDGKCYIGRTKNFYNRFCQYVGDFRHRKIKHINNYLLNAMEKYGFDKFTFEIIKRCSVEETKEEELKSILEHKSNNKDFGYNLRLDTSGGMIVSELTKEKISKRLKKEWDSGIRNNHSKKLKESWNNRDRIEQSKLMTKNLTKYYYIIDNNEIKLTYQEVLKELGKFPAYIFHRSKTNKGTYKGRVIERFNLLKI